MKSGLFTIAVLPLLLSMVSCGGKFLPEKPKTVTPNYQLSISSGNSQQGYAGVALPEFFVVNVIDLNAKSSAASSVQVNWSVASGGGTITDQEYITDIFGTAGAILTTGMSAGTNTVKASIPGTSQSVTFTATTTLGPPSASTSTISGSGPVEADGSSSSTITIILKDSVNHLLAGRTPTFSATGSNNTYGACSASDANGSSTCSLKSTTPETKILSILTPVSKIGGTVTFATGAASIAHSSITGTSNIIANGVATSTVTITLKDAANVAVSGITPIFSATNTGAGNTYNSCTLSNSSGISTCTMSSTYAETKTLSITSPISLSGGTTIFIPGAASASTFTITGTSPIENDGTTTSSITITLKDANGNFVSGTIPTFSATDTGSTNVYGICSSTNASGVSTCTLASTRAEIKQLNLLTPVSVAGGTVTFASTAATAANSSITGTTSITANGIATSTVTITLKDVANVPLAGITPTFSATNTGAGNAYQACSATNSLGVSTCTFTSTHAETKTLSISSPVVKAGGSVIFVPGSPATATSTITGTGPVTANGTSTSTITITLKDANSNAVPSILPTFSATNTGGSNVYSTCSLGNASGVSTCTLKSSNAETKTLSITSPISTPGGTVVFSAGSASIATSTITGSGPVPNDGVSSSTITIKLLDATSNPVAGTTPTFSATDSGSNNIYGACSASSSSGFSTCTLKSSTAETKTLSITSPISMSGGTVVFSPGAASAVNSSIVGTSNITANGVATSTITITLKDANNLAITGTTPTFAATNTNNGNTYGSCSATNASGVSTCSLSSTHAESKTLAITSPLNLNGGSISFIASTPSASTSQITVTSLITANGVSTSSISIVLYDAFSNPISGTTPTFLATDTGGTNLYGNCSSSNASGLSTCTLASTKAEAKQLSLQTPVSVSGGSVSFIADSVSTLYSSITGTSGIGANGSNASVISISLKDAFNNPISGTTPTFSATNTGGLNTQTACTVSNNSGTSTCTLSSTKAETKTLSILTPIALSGGTVTFTQSPNSANSSISGSGPVTADGVSTSTITITIHDYANTGIAGITPTFSATNSGSDNSYGGCSASNALGVSTCTLQSGTAETKTLQINTPVSISGGNVIFN